LRPDMAGHPDHRAGGDGTHHAAGGPEPVRGAEPAQGRLHECRDLGCLAFRGGAFRHDRAAGGVSAAGVVAAGCGGWLNMKLTFEVIHDGGTRPLQADIRELVVAGWAGRDLAAIEHHIEELAAIGVPRPSAVPLYYRIAANQLIQDQEVQVVGDGSSGEAEVFLFSSQGRTLVSLASDHTDRKLEAHSVALSKQLCVKPVATQAWLYEDVAHHWDEL